MKKKFIYTLLLCVLLAACSRGYIAKSFGFIAIEQALNAPDTFYIEKLAVAPEYRHSGIGVHLMNFASNRIKELGGKRISIGLIDSNAVLKEWYKKQGYVAFETKSFAHLPFSVCLMDKSIDL